MPIEFCEGSLTRLKLTALIGSRTSDEGNQTGGLEQTSYVVFSRWGSFQSGRTKWHVYPFGIRCR